MSTIIKRINQNHEWISDDGNSNIVIGVQNTSDSITMGFNLNSTPFFMRMGTLGLFINNIQIGVNDGVNLFVTAPFINFATLNTTLMRIGNVNTTLEIKSIVEIDHTLRIKKGDVQDTTILYSQDTTDNTPTNLASFPLPIGTTFITITVTAIKSTFDDNYCTTLNNFYTWDESDVVDGGMTRRDERGSLVSATLIFVGSTVHLQVTGVAASTYHWKVKSNVFSNS